MLPRENRLRKSSEFKQVRDHSPAHRHRLMVLWARVHGGAGVRLGFSVSRSVGRAVVRNRTRRRLRAATARLLPRLREGHDIVVSARPAAAGADMTTLEEALEGLCRRAGVLKERIEETV